MVILAVSADGRAAPAIAPKERAPTPPILPAGAAGGTDQRRDGAGPERAAGQSHADGDLYAPGSPSVHIALAASRATSSSLHGAWPTTQDPHGNLNRSLVQGRTWGGRRHPPAITSCISGLPRPPANSGGATSKVCTWRSTRLGPSGAEHLPSVTLFQHRDQLWRRHRWLVGGWRHRQRFGRAGHVKEGLLAAAGDEQGQEPSGRGVDTVLVGNVAGTPQESAGGRGYQLVAQAEREFAIQHVERFVLPEMDVQWRRGALR